MYQSTKLTFGMSALLYKMIREGEHQGQDFKFCINDSKKIARSLVAFANTDGGRLLIGVKDNGRIAGVRSDEEYYMVEAAAKIYSKPPIRFRTRQHTAEGKTVLEITNEASNEKPHFAKDDNGKWLKKKKKNDENKLANKVMLEVWKKNNQQEGILIHYSENEKCLLDWLEKNKSVSVSRFAGLAHMSFFRAEEVIIEFIILGILRIDTKGANIIYSLNENFDREEWKISMMK